MKKYLFMILLIIPFYCIAGAEEVYVQKVDDDNAIIVRKNNESYFIEKGVGCISLWRYEGKYVLIVSPSMFLGIGSKLILPDENEECRIWDSKYIGNSSEKFHSNNTCSSEQWITKKSTDSSVIFLSDGTEWEINSLYNIYSTLWLPMQKITVCNDQLINIDTGDKVIATQLR